MARIHRFAPWLWIAYLVVSIPGWGLFDGRPLGLMETSALVVVVWLWCSRARLGLAPLVGVALIGKVVLGLTLVAPRGFEARYYANATFAPPVERSVEPAPPGVTRVDDRLRFGVPGAPDLPVHFFNDPKRFNFYLPAEPSRATLPVSVAWGGTLHASDSGRQRFYIRKPVGTIAAITIGSALTAQIPPSATVWTGDANVDAGDHRVSISLAIPQGGARIFEAGRVVDGREHPLDSTAVSQRPVSAAALALDRAIRILSVTIDLVLCGWLASAFGRRLRGAWQRLWPRFAVEDALALGWALAIGDALVWALPAFERMTTLSGGDDWLTYESLARDIAMNGLWMRGGAQLGHGMPFYFQPLYPYFVAACHWTFGDALFGVYFVQRLLVAATVVALWRTTAALFDERVGAAGLAAAIVILYEKVGVWSSVLLSETLFVPLVCVWAYVLTRLADGHERSDGAAGFRPALAISAGLLGGLATLTRSTLVLGWLVALPALAFALKRSRRWATLALVVTAMVGVTSLAALRNWVVAGAFVPITSTGSLNLSIGNEPPRTLTTPPEHKAAYERLGFDANTQKVVEYLRQEPRAFLAGLERKATYTLGWFDTLRPGAGRSNFYMATWALALVGGALLLGGRATASPPTWAVAIPAALAMAHFAAMVIIFPTVYGDRLILPFYALLTPYVGLTLFVVCRRMASLGVDAAPGLVWAAALSTCLWTAFVGWAAFDPWMAVVVALLVGVWAAGPLDMSWRHVWPSLAFAVALVWLAWWSWATRSADLKMSSRAEWLFLAGALWSGRLVRPSREFHAYVAMLTAGCCLVAASLIVRAGPSAPWIARTHALAATPTYHEVAVLCAWIGIGLVVVLPVARRWSQTVVAAGAYLAGAALGVAALDLVNGSAPFSWTLVRTVHTVLGSVGTFCYLLVWIWGAWPVRIEGSGWSILTFRILQGMVVAVFIGAQAGVELETASGGAMLMVTALLIGAARSCRYGSAGGVPQSGLL